MMSSFFNFPSVGEAILSTKQYLSEMCLWIIKSLFAVSTPFIEWGVKGVIVGCLIIYYCSSDKKAISMGIKCVLIYSVFMMLRGVIL